MRMIRRSLWVAFVALLGATGLAVAWTTTTAVQLLVATALIMGGADHPLVGPKDPPAFVTAYLDNAVNRYINSPAAAGAGTAGSVDNAVAVAYPAEFFPVFGSKTFDRTVAEGRANLHNCLNDTECVFNEEVGSDYPPPADDDIVVFGYSESAVVASLVKRDLVDNYVQGDTKSFFLVANSMRGNGGILMRGFGLPSIPFFGITFYGATPTDSEVLNDGGTPDDPTDDTYAYPTVDAAQQYDFFGGDAPYRVLNPLAMINSLAAYALLHGAVVNRPLSDAEYQGRLGDTTYYLFTTDLVPVLMPLQMVGVPKPILSALDEFFRVVIEDAYLRDVNPGVATAASLLPIGNPIALALKLLAAVPVAIDNALEDLGVGRALGTTASGPFGVGGPALPAPPSALDTTSFSALAAQTEVVDDTTESVVPEAQSLVSEKRREPAADPETVAGANDEPEPIEPETATEEEAETTTPEPNETPSATDPDRPEVRGPIQFDSPVPQPDSPSNDQDDASNTETTPDPSPTGADDQDDQDDQNDDQDAAA